MEFREYLKTLADPNKFASILNTSHAYLKQIAGGHRKAGESLAIDIERESNGIVRCEELRPDVDWEYIRSTKPAKKKSA